jgi:hypothetical protein
MYEERKTEKLLHRIRNRESHQHLETNTFHVRWMMISLYRTARTNVLFKVCRKKLSTLTNARMKSGLVLEFKEKKTG